MVPCLGGGPGTFGSPAGRSSSISRTRCARRVARGEDPRVGSSWLALGEPGGVRPGVDAFKLTDR